MVRRIKGCPIFCYEEECEGFVSHVCELIKNKGMRILAWILMDKAVQRMESTNQK